MFPQYLYAQSTATKLTHSRHVDLLLHLLLRGRRWRSHTTRGCRGLLWWWRISEQLMGSICEGEWVLSCHHPLYNMMKDSELKDCISQKIKPYTLQTLSTSGNLQTLETLRLQIFKLVISFSSSINVWMVKKITKLKMNHHHNLQFKYDCVIVRQYVLHSLYLD